MMAVIFEVWPAAGRKEEYLKMAAELRAEVEAIDGFISVERFESLYEQGKLLSLQYWRDEDSIRNGAITWITAVPRRWAARACSPTTGCAWRPLCAITGRTSAKRRPRICDSALMQA